MTSTTIDTTIISTQSAPRSRIVSGLPIEGGLAGYFTNGIPNMARNPNRPTSSDSCRGRTPPVRP